ncbi:MAG: 23S rRNA (pseudouridine(1915)-N(3))-methyltransferase RlmH [Gammaproteobacteria bacterium]|nr:23S rRNA (pseudouridine(1915)-N(3))-methyltransferase RlmH [Gammaproteobacteria bacterium]
MKIQIHAIGKRMPHWVREGFEDYQSRFPRHIKLTLREINMPERAGNADILRLKEEEGERLLSAVPPDDVVIALDEGGKQWGSRQLAAQFHNWLADKRDLSLLIGGPDGLSRMCLERANITWSLSRLTLPHMLVRVVLAEQLYRAYAITQNHPYHRD